MKPLQLAPDAPWKDRFRTWRVVFAETAQANPARGLAVTNRSGIYQLYAWDIKTGTLTQLTDIPTGKGNGVISPDGRWVYYLQDDAGNEIGHIVRVPFEGGEPRDMTPDMPPYSSWFWGESRSGSTFGFASATKKGFSFYHMDLAEDGTPSEPRLFAQYERMSFGPWLSYAGDIAVVASTEKTGTTATSLVAFDLSSGEQVAELWDGDENAIRPVAFSPLPGDTRLLAVTEKSGFPRPLIWNPRTGERIDIPLDHLEGDIAALDWFPAADRLFVRQLNRAEYKIYVYDIESANLTSLDHPSGSFAGGYVTQDGTIHTIWQDTSHPTTLIELDPDNQKQYSIVLAAGEVPTSQPWRSVNFESSGGALIQAWVATPEGDGPFPTILHTHGGPTSVTTETFAPMTQSWLDHGFAFCSVNYRGSTTFGRDFEHAIWGNLGDLEVDDMAAARDWLVENGIADPDAILLTGWSYGGYLTLQAAGRRSDLWAGAMAGIAIADWVLMYEDQAETLRGYQRALFGGTPEEKPEAHRTSSPITYAGDVSAPVLVIQGRNDTRCPSRQLEVYEEKLKSLGKQIEVHWFEAGHGSMQVDEQIAHQETMLRFAYRVLG